MTLVAPSEVELAQSEFEVKLTGSASRALLALSACLRYDPGVLSLVSTDFTGTVWEDSLIDSVSDSGAGIIKVEALRRQADAVRPGVALLFLNLIFTPVSRATGVKIRFRKRRSSLPDSDFRRPLSGSHHDQFVGELRRQSTRE